jgi:predicted nucleic acid-binding protein
LSTYFDTSFLISIYCPDANTARALEAMRNVQGQLWVSTFAELEFINTLYLRVFRREDSAPESQSSLNAYEQDLRAGIFQLKPLPEHVFVRSRQLSSQSTTTLGIRAGQLLHVAAALELGAKEFYTFDRQQSRLAEMMKLKVNALA